MNNSASMGRINDLIRQGIAKLKREDLNQTEIATRCHLSQSTINKYIKQDLTPTRTTLKKLSHGLNIPLDEFYAAEQFDAYGITKAHAPSLPDSIAKLIDLAKQLDKEEILTLNRCAESLIRSQPDVRQHLIGQLKIIERLMQHELSTGPPSQNEKGAG